MTLTTLYDENLYEKPATASYWEASAPPPPKDSGPLAGAQSCEVAVIGGGFCGLSAGYHLAKDHGREVRVLEANHLGWGASGRNGGFCSFPAGKLSIETMIERFGFEGTRAYMQSQLDAIDLVDQLGREEAIDYDRQGSGFYEVAHRPQAVPHMTAYGEALKQFGVSTKVLSKEEFAAVGHRGTEQFGALHIQKGFGLHPLKFHRGFAAAALKRGAIVHGNTMVERWETSGGLHRLHTAGGTLTAKQVILATNGYLREGLNRNFDGRVLPALSNILTTRPLSDAELAAENFVTESPLLNTRRLIFYYRLLKDRRLLFGARGDTDGTPASAAKMQVWLTKRLGEVFPAFAKAEASHFWRGLVSLTTTRMPVVGRLPNDRTVLFAYGCHGNGVNTMPWAGRALAKLAAGANRDEDEIPSPILGLSPRFPVPALRRFYLKTAYLWYGLKDG
jgi:glycine/D-amino acid oxidase-like deaminating enzyme